jgi:hypothetical protein
MKAHNRLKCAPDSTAPSRAPLSGLFQAAPGLSDGGDVLDAALKRACFQRRFRLKLNDECACVLSCSHNEREYKRAACLKS